MLRQAPAQRGVQRRGHPGEKNSGTERRMRQSVYFRQSDDAKNNNVRYLLQPGDSTAWHVFLFFFLCIRRSLKNLLINNFK